MKKLVSLLLTLMLVCSVCAFVHAESEYAEHFDISIGTPSALADDSWKDIYFNRYIQEKFNVNLIPYSSSAGFDEVTNLWISTGDMPDWITAGNDLEGLMEYADQGLLAPLPEGWEERYPNLAAEVNAAGVTEYCKMDGRWYILPRVVFSPNFPLDFAKNPPSHVTQYYRTDWLETPLPDLLTMADLRKTVERIVADRAAAGEQVFGVTGSKEKIVDFFLKPEVAYYTAIYPIDGQYVLGAAQSGVVEAIKAMKEWYEAGLIDPDFFSRTSSDYQNLFYLDKAFIMVHDGGAEHCNSIGTQLMDNNPEMIGTPAMNMFNVLAANGVDFNYTWSTGFWRTLEFSPKLVNQPEKFERILAILDFLSLPETVCTFRLGEKGVNWDYDENGKPYVTDTPYAYDAGWYTLYHMSPSSQDAYAYGYNPSVADWAIDMSVRQMNVKSEGMVKNEKLPTLSEITKFDRWNSDAKTNFKGIGWQDEIVRIVLAGDVDVEAEWNKFLDANKGLWQPLLDEMNASLK